MNSLIIIIIPYLTRGLSAYYLLEGRRERESETAYAYVWRHAMVSQN